MKIDFLHKVEGFLYLPTIKQMFSIAWHANTFYLVIILAVQALQAVIPLAIVWITKSLFNLVANGIGSGFQNLESSFTPLLGAQVALGILSLSLSAVVGFLQLELNYKMGLNTQIQVYQKINHLEGIAPLEDPRLHDMMQMGMEGAQLGPGQILDTLLSIGRDVISLLAFAGTLFAFSPGIAGLLMIATLLPLFIQTMLGRMRFTVASKNRLQQRRLGFLGQVLSGVQYAKEIWLFNLLDFFLKKYQKVNTEIHTIDRAQQKQELIWRVLLNTLANLISSGAYVLVVIQALNGGINIGDIALYTGAVASVQGSLNNIVFSISKLNSSILFFTQYTNLFNIPQPIQIAQSPRPVTALIRSIEFTDISFRYNDQLPWILRNLNLLIPAGKCTALVGLNGAGKTTLIKLLTRLYDPTDGNITWDGIDIRGFNPQQLRKKMSVIFQDFARYDLSVNENIGVGDISHMHSQEHIKEAAHKAGVNQVISRLPLASSTILSRYLGDDKNGVDLSGGEWQKIALARLFMREPDLLILDEPTSALDPQSEFDLFQQFNELSAGRTSLLITHRLNTIKMADFIAVLDQGTIAEFGSHAELMKKNGIYARLYTMQSSQYDQG